jgi:hypothetical protein
LFPPWGSGPPFPKMAPPFTGSAHTPLPGSGTVPEIYSSFKLVLQKSLSLLIMLILLRAASAITKVLGKQLMAYEQGLEATEILRNLS